MIKKFHAQTTRDALRQVRDALGASAIILSNRQVAGGVEIIAVADLDMAALTAQAEPALWAAANQAAAKPVASQKPAAAARPAQPAKPSISLEEAGPQLATLAEFLEQRQGRPADRPAEAGTTIRPSPARQQQARPPAEPETAPEAPQVQAVPVAVAGVDELTREVRLLRGMVEGQLAGFAWNDLTRRDPLRAELMKRLLAAGFSAGFSRQLVERLPQDEGDINQALKWLKSTIAHNIKIAAPEDDIVEKGGVYALVGPTGVGKTTTVAKIAARAVLRHGASKVALVTTDTYRIGAQDQLRIYGRILGTPVFAVRDENDLELTLSDLHSRHLVLIDTVGMSQRDKRVAEQVALLCGEGREVKRLLLLGAPSQGITLEEVARAYAGPGLIGGVLTKIDEALTFGPVLDVAIRHELPVHFVTNGQRVPEDLHLANATYLADRAFRVNQTESPFSQAEGDYPILMAAAQGQGVLEEVAGGVAGAAG
ncbi:MAG: flagellar biosynthesis protein FlhF [Pseudomonadota bacterium]